MKASGKRGGSSDSLSRCAVNWNDRRLFEMFRVDIRCDWSHQREGRDSQFVLIG